jgi:HAD superfamily hydrolase (TIGR01509 family)
MTETGPVFIDLDGTLADSLPAMRRVFFQFLGHYGLAPDEALFQSLNGPHLGQIVSLLKARYHLAETEATLLGRYRGIIRRAYEDGVQPFPGSRAVLEALRAEGRRLGLVTATEGELVREFLDRHDLGGLFEITVSGDEVSRAKPDPALYRLAVSRAGAAAGDCLAVEDSINGVKSALAAGVRAVGFAPRGEGEKLRGAGARTVVAGWADLPAALAGRGD